MSASLVGSEMCIRDSSGAGVVQLPGKVRRALCQGCGVELTFIGPTGPACGACCEILRLAGLLAVRGGQLSPARRELADRFLWRLAELIACLLYTSPSPRD
eukprot:12014315-Alexandrium_andersonii.AAC.1